MPKGLVAPWQKGSCDHSISRLARKGALMRVFQDMYVQPIQTSFGFRPPAVEKVLT